MLRIVSTALTGFAAVLLLAALGAAPSTAATPTGPGAAAEGYGLLVDAHLLAGNVPLQQGPLAWAAQDYPPGAAQPATANVLGAGPQPADGSVVNHVGVMDSTASATNTPKAVGVAEAAQVSLLNQAGVPLISADLVRSQANADCSTDPNATGTTFVNLSVGGTPVGNTPAPNTVIDLVVAKVIINEQHPAADGRGIVVNAIHVISTTTGSPLFLGDIIVSHAMATVSCTNGAGTTGSSSILPITKTVTPNVVNPGAQVTYTATFTNKSTDDCLVNEAIDHLPPGFTLVSTAGDLGTAASTRDRPGGAVDIVVAGGSTIAHGKSATQTFVVKVGDKVAPGVFFNDVELLCANIGDFVKGLDAPVQVVAVPAPTPPITAAPAPAQLPETGADTRGLALGAAIALVAALAGRTLRRTAHR
jgi:uncharacterized repeat protein (TIGR01451 family)